MNNNDLAIVRTLLSRAIILERCHDHQRNLADYWRSRFEDEKSERVRWHLKWLGLTDHVRRNSFDKIDQNPYD